MAATSRRAKMKRISYFIPSILTSHRNLLHRVVGVSTHKSLKGQFIGISEKKCIRYLIETDKVKFMSLVFLRMAQVVL